MWGWTRTTPSWFDLYEEFGGVSEGGNDSQFNIWVDRSLIKSVIREFIENINKFLSIASSISPPNLCHIDFGRQSSLTKCEAQSVSFFPISNRQKTMDGIVEQKKSKIIIWDLFRKARFVSILLAVRMHRFGGREAKLQIKKSPSSI